MNNFKLVVFDLAGTTVKDHGNVARCFMDAFSEQGLQVDEESVNKVMGYRKKDAVLSLLQKLNIAEERRNELAETIHDSFTRSMIAFYENDSALEPMPYAEEVFLNLRGRGIKIALNTGFTKPITDTILKRLNWQVPQTADAVISSDEVEQGRPYPLMLRAIMQMLNVEPGQVVKIGDTEVDIHEGRNAGCGLVIGIASGAYSRQSLLQEKPDMVIDNLEELLHII